MLTKFIEKTVGKIADTWHKNSPAPAAYSPPRPEAIIKPIEKTIERIVNKEVIPVWAADLEPYRQLLQQVEGHSQLGRILLASTQHDPNESTRLVRLLVCAAQWENVLRVWDALAEQCKKSQQAITSSEQAILQACLDLYNQTLLDKNASLQTIAIGGNYNYHQQQRANSKGERIDVVLLQGVINAADENVRSALVLTS